MDGETVMNRRTIIWMSEYEKRDKWNQFRNERRDEMRREREEDWLK